MKFKYFLLAFIFISFFTIDIGNAQTAEGKLKQERLKLAAKKHEKLNLTEEQKEKIQDLKLKLQKELLPIQAELRNAEAELKTMLLEKQPDLRAVNKKIDQISKLQADIKKLKIRHQFDVRNLLTPEQQKKFDQNRLWGKKRAGKKMPHRFMRRCR